MLAQWTTTRQGHSKSPARRHMLPRQVAIKMQFAKTIVEHGQCCISERIAQRAMVLSTWNGSAQGIAFQCSAHQPQNGRSVILMPAQSPGRMGEPGPGWPLVSEQGPTDTGRS